jgi:hypothetical protein
MKRNKIIKKTKSVIPKGVVEYDRNIISNLVLQGDLKGLNSDQKVKYYSNICKALGLNPLSKPFDLITLQGKEIMYANKGAAEQLRKIHKISIVEMIKSQKETMYEVTVKAQDATGRYEIASGAVSIIYPDKIKTGDGWKDNPKAGKLYNGEDMSIAIMKAETKAKRRVTLALCGMGMLDESELDFYQYDEARVEDERENRRQEKIAKMETISDKLREGFRLVKYSMSMAYTFCEKFQWDEGKIMVELNKIIDSKEGLK